MRIECANCTCKEFSVVKTYPYEGYTIRQLKCSHCGANVFTHERVLSKEEYKWQHDKETKRSWIDLA